MLLGLTEPDRGDISVFGQTPREAVVSGTIGAMLQSGSLLDDATVAETVGLVAALHREPLTVAEALARVDITDLANRKCTSSPAARSNGCASHWHWSATRTCSCWTSRRWRWTWRPDGSSGAACASTPTQAARSCSPRITCTDSDAALRALLATWPHAHDIEITAVGLEDAFLALTAEEDK